MADLHDVQFGSYLLSRERHEDPDWSSSPHSRYTLYRKSPAEDPDYPAPAEHVGSMMIKHDIGSSVTRYAGPVGEPTTKAPASPEMATRGFNQRWAGRASRHGGQIPLFEHKSTRAQDEVDLMTVAKEARHMAPTMLGVAANAALQRGSELRAPTSLSTHSQRMVDTLKERGAVPSEHKAAWNSLSFEPPHSTGVYGGLEGLHSTLTGDEKAVPVSEVKKGQRTMRSILGRRRQAQTGEQLSLF